MKYLYLFILLLLFVPSVSLAAQINSFMSDISLQTDGTFIVTETIEYDFGSDYQHGIFRTLKTGHPQEATSPLKERYAAIELQDVKLNGEDVPYEVSTFMREMEVKIGDPDVTISGLQTYTITYEVDGGYSHFDDGTAELYWDITGFGWPVAIHSVVARLHGEEGLFEEDSACYAGPEGSSEPCSSIERRGDGSIEFIASLGAYENLTIGQQINGGMVEKTVLERYKLWLLWLLLAPILLLAVVIYGYRYKTHYKTGAPIIAQYEPYENFKPMYAGMLLDGRLDPQDITAGIVYLAQQGFIKITKTDHTVLFFIEVDDYKVELRRPIGEAESNFLRAVLLLLFKSESAQIGETVLLSELKKDTSKQQANYVRLQQLRKDLKKDMETHGFYQQNATMLTILIASGIAFFALFFFIEVVPAGVLTFLFFGAIIAFILGLFLYERRTRRGYEALDHLKGFRLFLSVTDAERFKFHNAPQKSPEQFMQYLPYAIAFGVEKQWADAFKDLTIPNPEWYDSGSSGTFSAVNLTSSLGAFSTSFAASSGTSSSSSGGSGGGGFSGGGGGGGGGGSW